MNKKILVSIICITYNHEKYIKYALDGFLIQETNFDFEILIHDDASTDKTASILKKYEGKYPDKIKIIYQKENQYSKGISPIKLLLNKAQGKYLAFCEGDDYWIDKNKLQKQIDFLEKNSEYMAVYHNVLIVDENNNHLLEEIPVFSMKDEFDIDKNKYIIGLLPGQLASLVCRNFNEILRKKNILLENYKVNGDMKYPIIFLYQGKIKYLEDKMACYRRTYTGNSWNARIKNKNILFYKYNSFIELKRLVKDYSGVELNINEKLSGVFLESVYFFINNIKFENLKVVLKIWKKSEIKYKLFQKLIKSVKNKIVFFRGKNGK